MILDQVIRDTSTTTLRRFATVFLPVGIALLGLVAYWRFGSAAAAGWIWGVGGALTLASVFSPKANRLVYFGLMALTYPIGWMVFHLLIAVVYLVVITPLALVFRAMGRDSLGLGRGTSGESNWTPRAPAPAADRYFRQY